MEIEVLKQAVREVLREELEKIIKDIVLNLIAEEEPEADEKEFVDEEIRKEDYVSLEEVME